MNLWNYSGNVKNILKLKNYKFKLEMMIKTRKLKYHISNNVTQLALQLDFIEPSSLHCRIQICLYMHV